MLTRSGASVRRRRDAAIGTIELLERRTEVLEGKESLTEDDRQSALRINELLSHVTTDFKNYHFTLVDSIEDDEEAQKEQATLHEHELKVMEQVDRLGKLMAIPHKTKPIAALTRALYPAPIARLARAGMFTLYKPSTAHKFKRAGSA